MRMSRFISAAVVAAIVLVALSTQTVATKAVAGEFSVATSHERHIAMHADRSPSPAMNSGTQSESRFDVVHVDVAAEKAMRRRRALRGTGLSGRGVLFLFKGDSVPTFAFKNAGELSRCLA